MAAAAAAAAETTRKLYGYALSSNSVRIAALLNEKGLHYELVAVDLDNKTPEFLAISVRTTQALLFKMLIKFARSFNFLPASCSPSGRSPRSRTATTSSSVRTEISIASEFILAGPVTFRTN
jgi:hypothetical protein